MTNNEARYEFFNRDNQAQVLSKPDIKEIDNTEVQLLAQESISIINQYLPEWTPQEDFTIVVWNTAADSGCYVGKWKKRHHILITIAGSQDLVDPNKRMSLVLRVAHELIHQRVAEILKVDDPNGLGIKDKLQHRILKQMTDFEKASQIFVSGANASFLQKAINEGCAVHGELEIFEKMLLDEEITQDKRNAVVREIKQRKFDLERSKHDKRSTYVVGYNLVLKLINSFQGKSLSDLLGQINWEACGKVNADSAQYEKIIANPMTIPGIVN